MRVEHRNERRDSGPAIRASDGAVCDSKVERRLVVPVFVREAEGDPAPSRHQRSRPLVRLFAYRAREVRAEPIASWRCPQWKGHAPAQYLARDAQARRCYERASVPEVRIARNQRRSALASLRAVSGVGANQRLRRRSDARPSEQRRRLWAGQLSLGWVGGAGSQPALVSPDSRLQRNLGSSRMERTVWFEGRNDIGPTSARLDSRGRCFQTCAKVAPHYQLAAA